MNLKLSVEEFGETCNQIMDAFERGETDVSTTTALKLVGHIQAVLQEQRQMIDRIVETGTNGLQGFDRADRYSDTIRKMMRIATGG